ncbi:MAG TPA: hypothetical protein VIJ04_08130 [Xanthobacteraceae bacterium]
MSRIRTIKPEFFRHEELYEAEKECGLPLRVAYPALWTVADRDGRFRWRPRELKLDCLPYDDVDFVDVLAALEKAGFIVAYEVGGQRYGCIPSFPRHQVINQREASSKLASMPAGEALHAQGPVHAQDEPVHAHTEPVHAQDKHCGELEGEKEQEQEQEQEQKIELRSAPATPAGPPKYTDAVHELWQEGVITLQQFGVVEKLARSMIGKWLKDTGDDAQGVLAAIQFARGKRTNDPIPLITAGLKLKTTPPRHKPDPVMDGLKSAYDRAFGDDDLAAAA